MTRKYSLWLKPTILITGSSQEEIDTLATEAIQLYWETVHCVPSPTALVREIEAIYPFEWSSPTSVPSP
jgi:hypothetical protein